VKLREEERKDFMTEKVAWAKVARFGLILGLVVTGHGCESNKPEAQPVAQKDTQAESGRKNTSYNLKYVGCSPDKMVDVEIKSGAVADVDQYVFVCVGDKIRWFTDDDSSFITQFNVTKAAKTNDLFESGLAVIPSKPDTSPNVAGKSHKQVTDTQIVSKNAVLYNDYSYQVVAKDKNGKTVAASDPHVIPM
jgi:hypothetical protein